MAFPLNQTLPRMEAQMLDGRIDPDFQRAFLAEIPSDDDMIADGMLLISLGFAAALCAFGATLIIVCGITA